ncbi:MAG: L-histidine N(alpha)-methyltransferase [Xenococcaceae cyanobacterium MO_188.B29]|nr:L-histidine N(alpha)-methyltransferase [Xenococcaceae cyanobacterium MO_188.B29]
MSFLSQTGDTNSLEQFSQAKPLQIDCLLDNAIEAIDDGKDVIMGLSKSQKSLPPRYFYDSRGSQLFEQICQLPEYYPTRTEAEILKQYAPEIAQLTGACELIELGSGSSTKTRLLLDAYQGLNYPLEYCPIDVSGSMLKESAYQLLADYPRLHIHGLVGTYDRALTNLRPSVLPRKMVLFLGSTIGNFNPKECDRFLTQIVTALDEGDYFLLGIDLQKPKQILEAAYNDSQGVTAAFNLNILQHLNWRFQGNFEPTLFTHQAFYNSTQAQIEMHLACQKAHSVILDAPDFRVNFEPEETILTEISRKFDLHQMQDYLLAHQLKTLQVWTDSQRWFGVLLSQKQQHKQIINPN